MKTLNSLNSCSSLTLRQGIQGSIAILAALSLSALIGMMALAIDLTRFFIAQNQLQFISDSCALAGIAALPCASINTTSTSCAAVDYARASEAGQRIAQTNPVPGSDAITNVSFPQSNRVQCQVQLDGFLPSLLQAFGVGTQNLQAQSIATVWPQQTSCPLCGSSHFAGAINSTGSLIPVLVR
jgi:uncharacterized membrane protein